MPYALLIEGTRMSYESEHNYTEKEVEDKAASIIKDSKGTVFAYWSMTNIDRFMSFYHAAIRNKRILVIDARLAYVIDTLREKIDVLPDVMNDDNIKVYFRISKSCCYAEKDYPPKERKYLPKLVKACEIASDPKKYVMHLGFYRLMELVYIQPKNADFIYSQSEHMLEGEENEDMKRVLENWIAHFGITFHKAHCSGHASKSDIISVVERIDPKVLVPVHTQSADEFKKVHKNVKVPEKEKEMKI
jgi:ribonuclease J